MRNIIFLEFATSKDVEMLVGLLLVRTKAYL